MAGADLTRIGYYVVDAALVAKWIFPEQCSDIAASLLAARARGRIELLAPDLLIGELASICRRKARAGDIAPERIGEQMALALAAAPLLVPVAELVAPALELSVRHDRPFAEAAHLALAMREGCPYVTTEERVLRALGPAFPCVRLLADVQLP